MSQPKLDEKEFDVGFNTHSKSSPEDCSAFLREQITTYGEDQVAHALFSWPDTRFTTWGDFTIFHNLVQNTQADTALVKAIIESFSPERRGEFVMRTNRLGHTGVHSSASNPYTGDSSEITELLLGYIPETQRATLMAEPNAPDGKESVVEAALSRTKNLKKVMGLFHHLTPDQRQAILTKPAGHGNNAIHTTAEEGDLELLKKMLECFPKEKWGEEAIRPNIYNGRTTIQYAARGGQTETLQFLLEQVPPDQHLALITTHDKEGGSALTHAAKSGKRELLDAMLGIIPPEQRAAAIMVPDSDGRTIMHSAAKSRKITTIEILLGYLSPEQRLQVIGQPDAYGANAIDTAKTYSRGNNNLVDYLESIVEAQGQMPAPDVVIAGAAGNASAPLDGNELGRK